MDNNIEIKTITIPIDKDMYEYHDRIFGKTKVTFKEGLTILVGCNGTGKTSLISQIIKYCKSNKIVYDYYNNLTDGGGRNLSKFIFYGNFEAVNMLSFKSEGETICSNMGLIVGRLRNKFKDVKNEEIFLILDAVDSGLSIDNILELKSVLKLFIKDQQEINGNTVFVLASANEYELASGEMCFDAAACKYVNIRNYEAYKKFILKSRERKNARIEAYNKYMEEEHESVRRRGRKSSKIKKMEDDEDEEKSYRPSLEIKRDTNQEEKKLEPCPIKYDTTNISTNQFNYSDYTVYNTLDKGGNYIE